MSSTPSSSGCFGFYFRITLTLTFGCLFYVVFYTNVPKINLNRMTGSFSRGNNNIDNKECKCDLKRNEPQSVENSPTGGQERLFYNRVPKCGSTTLVTMMRKLSKVNRFTHFSSKIYDKRMLSQREQKALVDTVMSSRSPSSFDRHVFYINFTQLGVNPSPIYINLIRDPVERIISSFFYRRVVARRQVSLNRTKGRPPSDFWMNKDFDWCVSHEDPECSFIEGQTYPMLLVPYFCGQFKRCLHLNDEWAVNRAKRTVETSYRVVGVLENINMTLEVLEAELPLFFRGVSSLYFDNKELRKNENRIKEEVKEEIKDILRANLTGEYLLYNFILERLHKQHRQLNVDKLFG